MKYDREQAIENATEVFWQLGFQGSKMRDLQTRMDMRPGSIYAGFGSKEGLFKQVLDHYVKQFQKKMAQYVEAADSPIDGLLQFFVGELITDKEMKQAPMCLLVKTLTELEESQPELANYAQDGMKTVASEFATYLTQAQQQGLLDPTDDPSRLAKWLQMQMMGLRLYAKNHPSEQEIREMIEDIFAHLK